MDKKLLIEEGKTALGIEFGSTRIKAVLIDKKGMPLASGSYEWENQYINGIWTYALEEVWKGLQECYKDLVQDVKNTYDVTLTKIGSLGFSAMMHGYLAFDQEEKLLVPFRTWRNTITEEAATKLTKEFNYNIPQRRMQLLRGNAHFRAESEFKPVGKARRRVDVYASGIDLA